MISREKLTKKASRTLFTINLRGRYKTEVWAIGLEDGDILIAKRDRILSPEDLAFGHFYTNEPSGIGRRMNHPRGGEIE